MKILKSAKTKDFHEIKVEYSFLWIKWVSVYRKFGKQIFSFKSPDRYSRIGMLEDSDIRGLFDIRDPEFYSEDN